MKINMKLIHGVFAVLMLSFSSLSTASSIYLAEIDPLLSSGVIEGENPYEISGTLKIIIDGNSIQFENINISTTPVDVSNQLIIADVGSYDGFNFEYTLSDIGLPVIGNWYGGTFDGSALFMQGVTFSDALYDFTINSSSISSVPLPNAFLLFSSGVFGLLISAYRKVSNK